MEWAIQGMIVTVAVAVAAAVAVAQKAAQWTTVRLLLRCSRLILTTKCWLSRLQLRLRCAPPRARLHNSSRNPVVFYDNAVSVFSRRPSPAAQVKTKHELDPVAVQVGGDALRR